VIKEAILHIEQMKNTNQVTPKKITFERVRDQLIDSWLRFSRSNAWIKIVGLLKRTSTFFSSLSLKFLMVSWR